MGASLSASGSRPWLIVFGGSSPVGASGHMASGQELAVRVPDLETIVVSVGSGGILAGLVASLGTDAVLGIDIGAMEDSLAAVASMDTEITDTIVSC